MRRILLLLICTLLLSSVSAQDQPKEKKQSKFGSFIRRVGESATGINMSNELFVSFDMKAQTAAQILEVACEGNPASSELLVTILAKAKKNGATMGLGSSRDDFAADAKGNRFSVNARNNKSKGHLDLLVDVPTRYEFVVKDVPADLAVLEVLSLGFYIITPDFRISDGPEIEPVQIRNIPIKWETMPTQNIVDESYELSAITQLYIVSCEGEKATGNVTLVIGATTEHKEASLSLGSDNYKLEAFDKSGNKYISTNGGGSVGEKFSKDLPKTFTYYFTDMGALESIYLLRVGFYAIGGDLRLGSNMAGVNPVSIKNIPITWK